MPEPLAAAESSKILNACDECRVRKLKCSGEPTGCARCLEDGVQCHYSPRKQMGRPRKRRRDYDQVQEGDGSGQNAASGASPGEETSQSLFTVDPLPPLNSNVTEAFPTPDLNSTLLDFDFSQDLGADPTLSFLLPPQLQGPPPQQSSAYQGSGELPGSVLPTGHPTACRCLSKLYVMLAAFQSSAPPSFPYTLSVLKRASKLAEDIVKCPYCILEHNSALQNSMLLGTLVNIIIGEYKRLLEHIDDRGASNEKFPLRMGENAPETAHLHTGTADCPMGIDLELSGQEWRLLARKAVSREVNGGSGQTGLFQIITDMRTRQIAWHSHHLHHNPHHNIGEDWRNRSENGEGCICVQVVFIDRLLLMLQGLDI